MNSFLGMQVEHGSKKIKLHLDHYVQEMLAGYMDHQETSLSQAHPIQPFLARRTDQSSSIHTSRDSTCCLWPSISLLQTCAQWICFDFAFAIMILELAWLLWTNGQNLTIWCSIWKEYQTCRSRTFSTREPARSFLQDLLTVMGGPALLAGPHPAT